MGFIAWAVISDGAKEHTWMTAELVPAHLLSQLT